MEIDNCNNKIINGTKILFQCFRCQKCCNDLGILDMIKISWATKTLMFQWSCKFLTENSCKIYYDNRPKLCKKYICGVVYES